MGLITRGYFRPCVLNGLPQMPKSFGRLPRRRLLFSYLRIKADVPDAGEEEECGIKTSMPALELLERFPSTFGIRSVISNSSAVRTCEVCLSPRCYLVSDDDLLPPPPPLPAFLSSPSYRHESYCTCLACTSLGYSPLLSTRSLPRCTVSCKCDSCGTCAFQDSSHWKCKLCQRPRCGSCADVPTEAVPWCSNPSCSSEMMSLA